MTYDVVIVGGGPGGLSAALALGRARKRVLVCDAGPRRNALAVQVHNFVTRDGTPPGEFRAVGREQLGTYPNVEIRDERVDSITGARGAFAVQLEGGAVTARRVILCTGMIDELLPVQGFAEQWGHSIFQCPYCHGWELQDRTWGYLARGVDAAKFHAFALLARGFTDDLVVFTHGEIDVPEDVRARFLEAGIRLETTPIARLVSGPQGLASVELDGGASLPCQVLFAHPPQRHVALVRDLVDAQGLALDEEGYVRVDAMTRMTSVPGVYAAGDLTTRAQSAIFAASAGTQAAVMINVDLAMQG